MDNIKEAEKYLKLKEEVLACAVCKTPFGRFYVPVVRQTT